MKTKLIIQIVNFLKRNFARYREMCQTKIRTENIYEVNNKMK